MKSLFGRKKSAQPQENPYAQQQAQEEYDRMTPYQRARADLANNSRPNVPGGLPSGPGPRRDGNASPAQSTQSFGGSTYAGSQGQGYGPNRYGSNQGYGMNRFDSNSTAVSANQSVPPTRPSGYGGFAPTEPADTSELYGGANESSGPNRYARQPQQPNGEQPNRYAAGASQGYGVSEEDNEYADQDLTPEQLEEKEFRKVKTQQMDVRRQIDASQDRSLAMLDQMIDTNSRTRANLASQGERLNRVHQNLNMSASHAKHAEAKTKELQTLNRSMFAITNPMTKKKKQAEMEQAYIAQNRLERQEQEALGRAQYQDTQQNENYFRNMENWRNKSDKYKDFDDDNDSGLSSDEEGDHDDAKAYKRMERSKNERMYAGLKMLNEAARENGELVRQQNTTIDRITEKTEGVTDHVVKNSAKLRTFK